MTPYEELPYYFTATPEEQAARLKDCENKNARFFRNYIIPSLIYAALYSLLIYQNSSSITMPLWILATIGYCVYALKNMGFAGKKDNLFYIAVMLLLGISTSITDNSVIITLNYIGFFLMLIAFLLHNFYDDAGWDFGKYLSQLIGCIFGAIGCIFRPFSDMAAFVNVRKKSNTSNKTIHYILIGVLCAIPCLLLLGICLASADAIFDKLLTSIFYDLNFFNRIPEISFLFVFGFFSSYCGLRFLALHKLSEENRLVTEHSPVIAITFLALLGSMYVIFCLIQVFYLFPGNTQMPEGMTYAQYARTGFFQLLFVCIVNLAIVFGIQKHFQNNRILRILLIIFCGCTFIMIASSAYRMLLYIDAYHLTFTRVFVLVALVLLTLLLIGALLFIVKPDFPVFRYSMIIVSAVYLVFSFSHVDYWIARYNLSHYDVSHSESNNTTIIGDREYDVDFYYISHHLSTDAAPAIASHMKQECQKDILLKAAMEEYQTAKNKQDYYHSNYAEYEYNNSNLDLYLDYIKANYSSLQPAPIYKFNLSRYIAGKILQIP